MSSLESTPQYSFINGKGDLVFLSRSSKYSWDYWYKKDANVIILVFGESRYHHRPIDVKSIKAEPYLWDKTLLNDYDTKLKLMIAQIDDRRCPCKC